MYYRIRDAHSISYLNGKEYINNELKTLDAHVNSIENHINDNDDIVNNTQQSEALSFIGGKCER